MKISKTDVNKMLTWTKFGTAGDAPYDRKITKGYNRISSFFNDITKRKSVRDHIKKIRIKYKIPGNGFYFPGDEMYFWNEPIIWNEKEHQKNLRKDVKSLCDKIGVYGPYMIDAIYDYILFNQSVIFFEWPMFFDSCFIENDPGFSQTASKRDKIQINKMYPVCLKIDAYASKKEIIDFIKKRIDVIKEIQDKYKNRKSLLMTKFRKRSEQIQNRNDYIYLLHEKGKSVKEISHVIASEFKNIDIPDEGLIGKIISMERNKRK